MKVGPVANDNRPRKILLSGATGYAGKDLREWICVGPACLLERGLIPTGG